MTAPRKPRAPRVDPATASTTCTTPVIVTYDARPPLKRGGVMLQVVWFVTVPKKAAREFALRVIDEAAQAMSKYGPYRSEGGVVKRGIARRVRRAGRAK